MNRPPAPLDRPPGPVRSPFSLPFSVRHSSFARVLLCSLPVAGCRADVLLGGLDDAGLDGSLGDSPPSIVGSDSTSICVTGQCTCTVDNQCIQDCGAQPQTSISGTVYDPAGNNPLYRIAVYIPENLPLPDLPGPPANLVSCPQCPDYYAKPVVAGDLTDAKGQFHFGHVPVGDHVPLVIQVGKWRHLTSISTKACQDNPIADKSLRLPSAGGANDTLPQFAISTGGADSMECLLKRVGVAETEYTSGSGGSGHIHIFQGGGSGSTAGPAMAGGSPQSSVALWPSGMELRKYDVIILSCEGDETAGINPIALGDYADIGGRVFASHFHYAWFTAGNSPFFNDNLAAWQTGTQDLGNIDALIQTGFVAGMEMHDWLKNVGALTNDELPIIQARYNAQVSPANSNSTSWIVADPNTIVPDAGSAAGATQYFSFDTPVGLSAEKQCGRIVYSDLHVGAASNDYGSTATAGHTSGGIVPSGCASGPLSPQEEALEFMLFDLAACFTPPNLLETNDWPK
jgi:hypothetical protein